MQHTAIVKEHCVSLLQRIAKSILGIIQQGREAVERGVKLGRRRKRERRLVLRGVIDVINISLEGELDRGVLAVKVVAVVDVLEFHWGAGENVKVGRVGLPEAVRDVESIDEGGDPSRDAIAQAMEDLVPRGVFEITELKGIINYGLLYKSKVGLTEGPYGARD